MQPGTNNVKAGTALIVCGALVAEVFQLKAKHGWDAHISAVPALLHSLPTILGRITIGQGSVIGGNVWLTEDVPPGSRIIQKSGG